MALEGWLFDLDGTLVDSNPSHVAAWMTALERVGYRVGADRVAVEIGKGGDKFVASVLGDSAEARHGDELRRAQGEAYLALVRDRGLKPVKGAVELLGALRRRGIRTALATSASPEHLEATERACGVRFRDRVDAVVGAGDVRAPKPAPDVVEVALAKLGLGAAQCALSGDTPWDAASARSAGVVFVGVTFGAYDAAALFGAGARAVYRDVADILEHLDEALVRASPGPLRYDAAMLRRLVGEALAAAEAGMQAGEVPIGAVLASGDGRVFARGQNRFVATGDKSAHAEIDAFRAAASHPGDPFAARDVIMVSSLEPCVMCTGAAMECAVDLIVYALPAPADAGSRRVTPPASVENQVSRIVGGIAADESRALFQRWLDRPHRDPRQEPYVRQLLAAGGRAGRDGA